MLTLRGPFLGFISCLLPTDLSNFVKKGVCKQQEHVLYKEREERSEKVKRECR
ncbi:hypothetical protein Hanom_Chr12g01129551 [Helianthus anomalus]